MPDKLMELLVFGLMPMLLGLLAAPLASVAAETEIVGEVSWRERIALPANARLTVELADVSLADAPASIVAEQTMAPAGQAPLAFSLRFDPTIIRPAASYALQARITVDDQLWFVTADRHDIDPLAPAPQRIALKSTR